MVIALIISSLCCLLFGFLILSLLQFVSLNYGLLSGFHMSDKIWASAKFILFLASVFIMCISFTQSIRCLIVRNKLCSISVHLTVGFHFYNKGLYMSTFASVFLFKSTSLANKILHVFTFRLLEWLSLCQKIISSFYGQL